MIQNEYDKQRTKICKIDNDINLIPLINLFWKLDSKIQKLNLSEQEKKPIVTYINAITDIFKGLGFDILDYTNKKYNFGDNVEILCVEGKGEDYFVKECLQPTIIQRNEILQRASVIIKGE